MLRSQGFNDNEIVFIDAADIKINHEKMSEVYLQLLKTLDTNGLYLGDRKPQMALIIDNVVGSYQQDQHVVERHTTLLKVLFELLHNHPNHPALLVIIADERATPAIRDLELKVKDTEKFYNPTQRDLKDLATITNQRHTLGLSIDQINSVVRASTNFSQLSNKMHLLTLLPTTKSKTFRDMTQIDGTGEPNLFQETHALFTREMPSKNQGETGRGLRE